MATSKEVQAAMGAFNTYQIALDTYNQNGDGYPQHVVNALEDFKKKLALCTDVERKILRTQLVKKK